MKIINDIRVLQQVAAAGSPEIGSSSSFESPEESTARAASMSESINAFFASMPYHKKATYRFLAGFGAMAVLGMLTNKMLHKTLDYLTDEIISLQHQINALRANRTKIEQR